MAESNLNHAPVSKHEFKLNQHERVVDNLDQMLAILPERIRDNLLQDPFTPELVEIVMDLGRVPEIRFRQHDSLLKQMEVTAADLQHTVTRLGEFGTDNRAGIERTLHRISAIRNRSGIVIGLTCRVGRAVSGTIEIIRDLITEGRNVLLLGRPGVGKTTLLREAARVLSEDRRVVIVDTSNEIAGDGDIPHPSIGRARRMQVPTTDLQHEVMIEAVENHMPETIVIDEIGREVEAQAARTIAERGVQLVGTAHGNTLDNLVMNPTLADLVGGLESVTLSDEEARRRGTRKSVLERRAPPTFDVLIEMRARQRVVIHMNIANAVDRLLRGWQLATELRFRDEHGDIQIEQEVDTQPSDQAFKAAGIRETKDLEIDEEAFHKNRHQTHRKEKRGQSENGQKALKFFAFGIGQSKLRASAKNLNVPVDFVNDINAADVVVTLKNYYRRQAQTFGYAERQNIPVYVLRNNTSAQMDQMLVDLFKITEMDPFESAMQEAQVAIQKIESGLDSVELAPQPTQVRSQQHQMIKAANLVSHSQGREPYRRVRITSTF